MRETHLIIPLPLPDSAMSGHAKGHWRAKAATTKIMRFQACAMAMGILGQTPAPKWKRAILILRFYLANNRRRDLLNLVNGVKAYIDGIVDAGVIVDDDWRVLKLGSASCEIDAANPRVEIELCRGNNDSP